MSAELVTTTVSNGIADIRLNRPDKHNSLTLDMFDAIAAAGDRIHTDPSIRVAVLSGNGPSFCAGLDFTVMQSFLEDGGSNPAARLAGREGGPENLAQRVAYTWKTAPVPVIAALTGVAYGGGFQIAMGCDLRIAAPGARLSIMEMRYGLIPDMSITQTLPEHLPRDVALELTLTAREVGGEEARQLGLVTRLDEDPLEAALGLATQIAARSPEAVRAVKQLYNETWRRDAERGLRLEESLQLELIGSPNQREAVAAAMEKRAPRFADRSA